MNTSPNLIPMHRQLRMARAARLRGWSYAGGGMVVALAVGWMACGLTTSRAVAPPPESFSKAAAEISKANEEAATLRRELAGLREQVAARQSVTGRADTSVLLAMLSQATGEDVVMSHCELANRDPRAADSPQVLRITGAARNQPEVAAFMLALESTGLFRNVTLVRSNQQQMMNTQVAGFQVECVIGPSQGGVR